MLWLALHFPELLLEVFSRGGVSTEPLAVSEKLGNRLRISACNEAASICGIHPGMPASAAQVLVNGLKVRGRDAAAEQESLAGLATWAGQFTPAVSLQPPAGLLLEIGSCLSLHGGLARLLRPMRRGLRELGYAYTHACAPTPHGAWLLALAGKEAAIREFPQLEPALAVLPVSVLAQPLETLAGLEMVGARTLGDCLRLPRTGLARRFGLALLNELDRALGRLPEARDFFVPPPSFQRRLELPAQVHEAEALLFATRRLVLELEGYLSRRQAGVQELELGCQHENTPDSVLKLGFVQPIGSADRILLLLRETLGRTCLPAAVHTITLNARLILPLAASNVDMFQDGAQPADGNLLLERLRIRLGKEAVHGITPAADHRPERASRHCEAGGGIDSACNVQRPLWLLPRPQSCKRDQLVLKSGPERIESGWWDGMDVARDYYVAQSRKGSQLWVYCDRASGEWFVHGLFA
jgi:protein ImuB